MEEKKTRRRKKGDAGPANSSGEQEPVLTIEESFRELESILEKLEDEECSLEDSFRWFEKGMQLVKSCSAQIDQVEKKIIVLSEEGEENAGL